MPRHATSLTRRVPCSIHLKMGVMFREATAFNSSLAALREALRRAHHDRMLSARCLHALAQTLGSCPDRLWKDALQHEKVAYNIYKVGRLPSPLLSLAASY